MNQLPVPRGVLLTLPHKTTRRANFSVQTSSGLAGT